jgi:hypothetical protein
VQSACLKQHQLPKKVKVCGLLEMSTTTGDHSLLIRPRLLITLSKWFHLSSHDYAVQFLQKLHQKQGQFESKRAIMRRAIGNKYASDPSTLHQRLAEFDRESLEMLDELWRYQRHALMKEWRRTVFREHDHVDDAVLRRLAHVAWLCVNDHAAATPSPPSSLTTNAHK